MNMRKMMIFATVSVLAVLVGFFTIGTQPTEATIVVTPVDPHSSSMQNTSFNNSYSSFSSMSHSSAFPSAYHPDDPVYESFTFFFEVMPYIDLTGVDFSSSSSFSSYSFSSYSQPSHATSSSSSSNHPMFDEYMRSGQIYSEPVQHSSSSFSSQPMSSHSSRSSSSTYNSSASQSQHSSSSHTSSTTITTVEVCYADMQHQLDEQRARIDNLIRSLETTIEQLKVELANYDRMVQANMNQQLSVIVTVSYPNSQPNPQQPTITITLSPLSQSSMSQLHTNSQNNQTTAYYTTTTTPSNQYSYATASCN